MRMIKGGAKLQYDWKGITSSAYLSILEINLTEFPVPAAKIKCKGVKIVSYQKYSEIAGVPIEQLTLSGELDDAFLLSGLRPDLKIILYNNEKLDSRLKHTIWHEIGHIKLNHMKHGKREEIEAHFFASQANAPNALIKEIAKRGYVINVNFLVEHFGLSKESAGKKVNYLKEYGFEHENEFDENLLLQFSDYLKIKYPPKTQHYYDNYFDELEKERETWV